MVQFSSVQWTNSNFRERERVDERIPCCISSGHILCSQSCLLSTFLWQFLEHKSFTIAFRTYARTTTIFADFCRNLNFEKVFKLKKVSGMERSSRWTSRWLNVSHSFMSFGTNCAMTKYYAPSFGDSITLLSQKKGT